MWLNGIGSLRSKCWKGRKRKEQEAQILRKISTSTAATEAKKMCISQLSHATNFHHFNNSNHLYFILTEFHFHKRLLSGLKFWLFHAVNFVPQYLPTHRANKFFPEYMKAKVETADWAQLCSSRNKTVFNSKTVVICYILLLYYWRVFYIIIWLGVNTNII